MTRSAPAFIAPPPAFEGCAPAPSVALKRRFEDPAAPRNRLLLLP